MLLVRKVFFILFISGAILASCNNDQASQEPNYEMTKKMVIDILQTEDGKKTIQEMMSSDGMKEHLVIASDVVKTAINETLLSEEGAKMWQTLFKDPSFAKGFAESMSDPQKELIKQLMKDPEYQQSLMEILQNPELSEQTLTLLKSQQFRSHLQTLITETVESPLFQAMMAETLLKMQGSGGEGGGSGEQSGESGGGKSSSE